MMMIVQTYSESDMIIMLIITAIMKKEMRKMIIMAWLLEKHKELKKHYNISLRNISYVT